LVAEADPCGRLERATPATTDDNLLPFAFPAVERKKVTAAFDGGRLSSDGGRTRLSAGERRFEPVWGFSCQELFLVCWRFFVRSGKAVLRSLIAPQVSRGCPLRLEENSVSTLVPRHWRNAVSLFG
jgi:hypothetical protein